MRLTGRAVAALLILVLAPAMPVDAGAACLSCHADKAQGFNPAHGFGGENCTSCHAGAADASGREEAHAGMFPFPGNMANAGQACGACHGDKVASVSHSLMHTGEGMVAVTRQLVDGQMGAEGGDNIQSLGHGPADSMLRKLCVSCHLGQTKTEHALDPAADRGGGCLACHINHYPEDAHPALTTTVTDGRCFGCHSRSGRISLNYTGLAEVDPSVEGSLRLADGRPVQRQPADVHYRAGMSCIDCHGGAELMGESASGKASCVQCHDPGAGHAAVMPDHERLECATCHSQWVPQCFGCHMSYDAGGRQWDHLEKRETPGSWHEERWDIRTGKGALGVTTDDRIALFVPGMIMSLAHPAWEQEKFVRVFAPLSPHTTGKARSCESCHRSSEALGLGEGVLEKTDGGLRFTPGRDRLRDGLPADAWTDLQGRGGASAKAGQRPLNRREMKTVLEAPLPGD